MAAVILAGRTGAAFAAQLGTMQVNEEIDAYDTLGISAIDFLVLPRVLALMLMVPLLTLYSGFIGMLAGLLVSTATIALLYLRADAARWLRHMLAPGRAPCAPAGSARR